MKTKDHTPPESRINCVSASCKEPRLRRLKRRILRAYWQHHDIVNPCDTMLGTKITQPEDLTKKSEVETVYAKDAIILRNEVHLSFADMIRCLFGCTLKVNSVIYCENDPGRTKPVTNSFASL